MMSDIIIAAIIGAVGAVLAALITQLAVILQLVKSGAERRKDFTEPPFLQRPYIKVLWRVFLAIWVVMFVIQKLTHVHGTPPDIRAIPSLVKTR
jgi:hypothetical protein